MAVLLLAEVTDGTLNMDATAKSVSAAKSLGDVTVLCTGASCADAAAEAATIEGVSKVLCAEDDLYGHRLAEPVAALVVSLAGDYEHIVAPATTDAKNILPRVAALLDVMVLTDVSGVVDSNTFERPIYAGNAIQDCQKQRSQKGRQCPCLHLRRCADGAGRHRWKTSVRARLRASANGLRTRSPPVTAPN